MAKKQSEMERLLKVVHELRTQCPWDKKQTHKSLSKYMVEEAFEAVDAIEASNTKAMEEELGDVLLQVALHAEIASEKKKFNFEKVAGSIADKMIRRHPHIYAKAEVKDYKSHMRNWTRLKEKEKPKKTLLSGIPKGMPALQLAQRYGEIASTVGFDWNDSRHVFEKVKEEVQELEAALAKKGKSKAEAREELGDLLFALSNLARHLGEDAEAVLRSGALKFAGRFEKMEKQFARRGKKLSDCSTQDLEAAWETVKKNP